MTEKDSSTVLNPPLPPLGFAPLLVPCVDPLSTDIADEKRLCSAPVIAHVKT